MVSAAGLRAGEGTGIQGLETCSPQQKQRCFLHMASSTFKTEKVLNENTNQVEIFARLKLESDDFNK